MLQGGCCSDRKGTWPTEVLQHGEFRELQGDYPHWELLGKEMRAQTRGKPQGSSDLRDLPWTITMQGVSLFITDVVKSYESALPEPWQTWSDYLLSCDKCLDGGKACSPSVSPVFVVRHSSHCGVLSRCENCCWAMGMWCGMWWDLLWCAGMWCG